MRAGVVTRMPWCSVISPAPSVGVRWMRSRPRSPAPRAHGDVDARGAGAPYVPQRRGRRVAQHRAGPGGEHRGHAAPVDREQGVTDGIDAVGGCDAAAPPARAARLRLARQAERGELPRRDDPVLAARQARNLRVQSPLDDFVAMSVRTELVVRLGTRPGWHGKHARAADARFVDDAGQAQHQPCTVGAPPKRREMPRDGGDRGVGGGGGDEQPLVRLGAAHEQAPAVGRPGQRAQRAGGREDARAAGTRADVVTRISVTPRVRTASAIRSPRGAHAAAPSSKRRREAARARRGCR